MLFSSNGRAYSLEANRIAEKNFCEELLTEDEEKGDFFVDEYIDEAEGLDDQLDVDFFNNLPTPVEEVKPWFSKQLMSFEKAFENVPTTLNTVARSSVMDFGRFQDLSGLIHRRHQVMDVEDSLSTPVIDPNSSLMSNGPFFQAPQRTEELDSCASPDDICGSFTVVSVCNTLPSSTQTMSNNANNNVTSVSNTYNINNNSYSSISSFTPSSMGAHIGTSSTSMNYTPNAFSFPTPSSTRSGTPSITPSSSSSSLIYAELKPRAFSSPSTIDLSMMPTVISDHPYFSKSVASGQAPSPCPSTSSMTSSSTIDTKDFKKLLLDDDDDTKPKKETRRKNNEASRRSRMTKKQKYDDMVNQEKELLKQNQNMKAKLSELEAVCAHLRTYLMDVMKKGANVK